MHHRRKASILRFILLFLYLNDSSSRDALFTNCLFWDASLRVAFLLCLFAWCLFAFCLLAWCLFVCCLFPLCRFACWLFACCFLAWCLFLRDTYMIVAFLVFFPFPMVFFFTNLDTVYFSFDSTPFHFYVIEFYHRYTLIHLGQEQSINLTGLAAYHDFNSFI